MAKVVTETIAIVVSKLVKDGSSTPDIVPAELVTQLEAAVTEMVGVDVVVEATKLVD